MISENCLQKKSNGCWVQNQAYEATQKRYLLSLAIFLSTLLFISIILGVILNYRRKKQHEENQRFNLQLLTHELRTPITTINLEFEAFRKRFDQFDSDQQLSLLKMSQEISRLKTIVEMSNAYLQTDRLSDRKLVLQMAVIEVDQFVGQFIDEWHQREPNEFIKLNIETSNLKIKVEPQWLKLCLSNLVKNAFDHGKPPVQISISAVNDLVMIQVQDQGELNQKEIEELAHPFHKRLKSPGLGLGLSITRQVIQEMHGRLIIDRRPTRFSLQLNRFT